MGAGAEIHAAGSLGVGGTTEDTEYTEIPVRRFSLGANVATEILWIPFILWSAFLARFRFDTRTRFNIGSRRAGPPA